MDRLLYVDFQTGNWCEAPIPPKTLLPNYKVVSPVFPATRGETFQFTLRVFNIPSDPSSWAKRPLHLALRAKQKGRPNSNLLLYTNRQYSGSVSVNKDEDTGTWYFDLPASIVVRSQGINDLLKVSGPSGASVMEVPLDFEIRIYSDSASGEIDRLITSPSTLHVYNNLKRDNDSPDAPAMQGYPEPDLVFTKDQAEAWLDEYFRTHPIGVKSIGGETGDILLGTNLSMNGKTINATGGEGAVKSVNGQTGEVIIGLNLTQTNIEGGSTLSLTNNRNYSVELRGSQYLSSTTAKFTTINGVADSIILGTNLSMSGNTINGTGVSSIGGKTGIISLGNRLTINSGGLLNTNFGPLELFEEYVDNTTYGIRLKGHIGSSATGVTFGTDEFGIGLRYLNSNVVIYPRTNETAERYLAYYPDTSLEHELRFQDVALYSELPNVTVTALGGKRGEILLGTNLSMVGNTLNAAGGEVPSNIITTDNIAQNAVTSFNGSKGTVTYTAPVTSVNGKTGAVTVTEFPANGITQANIASYAVTSFNGSKGAVTYTAPVVSVNGRTGAVTVTEFPANGITQANIGTYAVTSLGTKKGDILLGTNLTMTGQTLNAAGGEVPSNVVTTDNIASYAVTSFGTQKGDIVTGTNLSMTGKTVNASFTLPSNVITTGNIGTYAVTAFGGAKGNILTGTNISVTGQTVNVASPDLSNYATLNGNNNFTGTNTFNSSIVFRNPQAASEYQSIELDANGNLSFKTKGTLSMFLSNGGNLQSNNGITVHSSATLDVYGSSLFMGESTFDGKLIANADIENNTGVYFTPTNTPVLIGAVTSTADGTQHAWINIINANGPRMTGTMINETGSPFDTWLYTGQLAVGGTLSMGGNAIVQVKAGTNTTDAVNYSQLPVNPITQANIGTFAVTSLGNTKGDITLGTNLSMSGQTINASGGEVPTNIITTDNIAQNAVTSFNGSKGAVTYTAPVTSVNGRTGAVTVTEFPANGITQANIGTYAVTSFGEKVGDIIVGENLVMQGQTINATGGSGVAGVSSIGGMDGDIILSSDLTATSASKTIGLNKSTVAMQNQVNTFTNPQTFSDAIQFTNSETATVQSIQLTENGALSFKVDDSLALYISSTRLIAPQSGMSVSGVLSANGGINSSTLTVTSLATFNGKLVANANIENTTGIYYTPLGTRVQLGPWTSTSPTSGSARWLSFQSDLGELSVFSNYRSATETGEHYGNIRFGSNQESAQTTFRGNVLNFSNTKLSHVAAGTTGTDAVIVNQLPDWANFATLQGNNNFVGTNTFSARTTFNSGITNTNGIYFTPTSTPVQIGAVTLTADGAQHYWLYHSNNTTSAALSARRILETDTPANTSLYLTEGVASVVLGGGFLNLNSKRIVNLSPGTAATDAVNFSQLPNTSNFVTLDGTQTISGNKTFTGAVSISNATATSLSVVGTATFNGRGVFNNGITNINGLYYTPTGTEVRIGGVVAAADGTQHNWLSYRNEASSAGSLEAYQFLTEKVGANLYLGNAGNVTIAADSLNLNNKKIANLASGTATTDAANVSQLPTIPSGIITTDNIAQNAVTSFNSQKGAVSYTAPVTSVNSKTGAVTVTEFPANGITQANIGTYAVTSFNTKKGDVTYEYTLPDTVLTTANIAQNAVTSFNGNKGAVTYEYTLPSNVITTGNIATYAVTSFGTQKGDILTGTNLTMSGKTVNASFTLPSNVVTTDTVQVITAQKTFDERVDFNSMAAFNDSQFAGVAYFTSGLVNISGQFAVPAGTEVQIGSTEIAQSGGQTNNYITFDNSDVEKTSSLEARYIGDGVPTRRNAILQLGSSDYEVIISGSSLDLANKKIINVRQGSAATDAPNMGQLPTVPSGTILTSTNIDQYAVTGILYYQGQTEVMKGEVPIHLTVGQIGGVNSVYLTNNEVNDSIATSVITEGYTPAGMISTSNIGFYAVTKLGNASGNILLGTNLSMSGNTLNASGGAAGVTSVNGQTGAVLLGLSSVVGTTDLVETSIVASPNTASKTTGDPLVFGLSLPLQDEAGSPTGKVVDTLGTNVTADNIQEYAVTGINNTKGNFILGTNLSLSGNTINAAGGGLKYFQEVLYPSSGGNVAMIQMKSDTDATTAAFGSYVAGLKMEPYIYDSDPSVLITPWSMEEYASDKYLVFKTREGSGLGFDPKYILAQNIITSNEGGITTDNIAQSAVTSINGLRGAFTTGTGLSVSGRVLRTNLVNYPDNVSVFDSYNAGDTLFYVNQGKSPSIGLGNSRTAVTGWMEYIDFRTGDNNAIRIYVGNSQNNSGYGGFIVDLQGSGSETAISSDGFRYNGKQVLTQ